MEIQIREGSREQKRKLKVCAYCRVSTDADEQENSLENQVRHYETVIKANPDYEYAGVYSDFAISGFKEKRPGLQKMLADAEKGKIDLILTKSVSRFARNTSIVLEATRKLKELNVGAVSYTHLDVYKRQGKYTEKNLEWFLRTPDTCV